MGSFSTKLKQFSWYELKIVINGRPMVEATDIEYKTSKELEEVFGAGQDALFIGEGNKTRSGSIELLQSGYEALVEEAKKNGGDDVTDLEVDVIVAFVPKASASVVIAKTIVDRLIGVKFSEDGKKMSQGNTHSKMSIPFKMLGIEHQI